MRQPAVSEPDTPVADLAAVDARALRDSRVHLAAGMLAVFALAAALYLARGFFVPLLIGILASYALRPLVDWLQACRVPRSVGAALVLAILVGSFSWLGISMSDDATASRDIIGCRAVPAATTSGPPESMQGPVEGSCLAHPPRTSVA